MVTSFTPDLLVTYVSQKAISDAGRKQLQQIADQKGRVAGVDESLKQTRSKMEDATQAESRLRQNIVTLNSVSGQQDQVQTWSRQLASEEAEYTKLRDQAAGLDKQKAALGAELNGMIAKLEF
jgi:chromosome segregation ATPase